MVQREAPPSIFSRGSAKAVERPFSRPVAEKRQQKPGNLADHGVRPRDLIGTTAFPLIGGSRHMKSVAKNNADGSESIGGGGQMIKGWTTICQAKAGGGQMIEGWTTTCQAKSPNC